MKSLFIANLSHGLCVLVRVSVLCVISLPVCFCAEIRTVKRVLFFVFCLTSCVVVFFLAAFEWYRVNDRAACWKPHRRGTGLCLCPSVSRVCVSLCLHCTCQLFVVVLQADMLTTIRACSQSLLRIIDDILLLSKIEVCVSLCASLCVCEFLSVSFPMPFSLFRVCLLLFCC